MKEFSSKISKILIELYNYSFFHSPSEIKRVDRRFIGRKFIINKLKGILTNTETRSGAYLITGYRGMGKSSFVSKVISELVSYKNKTNYFSRFIRILIMLFFLSFFKLNSGRFLNNIFLIVIPIVVFVLFGIYLARNDRLKNELKIFSSKSKIIKKGLSIRNRTFRTFIVDDGINPEKIFYRLIKIFYISSFIHIVGRLIPSYFIDFEKYSFRIISYLIIWTLLVCVNYIYHLIRERKISHWWNVKKLFETICKKFKNFFNYSRRMYIKMNLGYEDLKEIDILRLISRNLERRYREFIKINRKNFIYKVLKIVCIFFLVGIFFYYSPLYELNKKFKKQIGINKYFPSQDYENIQNEIYENVIYFARQTYGSINNEIIKNFRYLIDKENYTLLKLEKLDDNKKIIAKILSKKLEKKEGIIKKIFCYCDSLVFTTYYRIRLFFGLNIKVRELTGVETINEAFILLPNNIDYLFWIYFLLTYLFITYLLPYMLGIATDETILKKIKKLNEIIDYKVTSEAGTSTTVSSFTIFNLFKKRIRAQPRADIREIEKRLIEILEEFDKYSRFRVKPEIVCIFDELDKIEPHTNISLEEKEEEFKDSELPETTYFATEGIRRRQHKIFKILSNLKHFLNVAKAKFIFIAGREMYDAALADVSDRNFFIGSIFHDVINVNSFLTDGSDNRISDISSLTESYVCQFLFPPFYKPDDYTLNEYKKYLDEYFACKDYSKEEKKLCQLKINKIIFTLHNFITYLTYRSNGAPKKITTCFENYIYKPDKEREKILPLLESENSLIVGFSRDNLYLRFGYYDQYTFGLISYLINPVVLAVSRAIKDFGDKLLVSTSFLVDHLYKFHKNAFSWRNIEMTPEILDINKAP